MFYKYIAIASSFALSISPYLHAASETETPAKVQAGWVEHITIEKQVFPTKAKLDTGAKTSSIYAEDIEQTKENGKHWVTFTLVLKDDHKKTHRIPLKREHSRQVLIKEHNGKHDSRPVVNLDICFDGRPYNTEFTLKDRREYIYGILLGRRFLEGKAVIDSEKTYLTLSSCQYSVQK